MKTLARANQTVVGVEVVLKPVEVQVPTLAVPIEVRHVAVAVGVAPKCTEYHLYHRPLIFLWAVSYSESLIPKHSAPSIFIFRD